MFLILVNSSPLLNTFTVLQLSRRIQLLGMALGPVWNVCPVSVPLGSPALLRSLRRSGCVLSVTAVTVEHDEDVSVEDEESEDGDSWDVESLRVRSKYAGIV